MPAARDSDWAHVHVAGGDRAAAAPYLPFARKLLGFVKQDAAFNRLATHQATRRLEDGALVRAELIGGIPRITIVPAPRGPGGPVPVLLEGFVTKPRKFGTQGTQNNGQNAFGQHAHVLLQTKGAGAAQEWRSLFYDATYVPTGYPLRVFGTFQGKTLLATGLAAHGNVDWRGKDEQVAITWVGNPSRVWLTATGDSYRGGSGRIYHNGREVLNHSVSYQSPDGWSVTETVAGACLRGAGPKAWLVYVVRPTVTGISGDVSSDEYRIRAYKVPLLPDFDACPWMRGLDATLSPLFKAANPADVEMIGELVFPNTGELIAADQTGLATAFFNQSATQARGLVLHTNNNAFGNAEVSIEITEVVIDLADDLSAATFSTTAHGDCYYTIDTSATFQEVMPAFYSELNFERPFEGDPELEPVGSYEIEYDKSYMVVDATVTSPIPKVFVASGTSSLTMTPVNAGPIPIGVDYEDDVPVYLWWTPETISIERVLTQNWEHEETGHVTETVVYDADHDLISQTLDRQRDNTAAYSISDATTTTVSGGRIYATDKTGAVWLDLDNDLTHSYSLVGSGSLALSTDGATYTADYSRSSTQAGGGGLATTIGLWWLDLRSRSAAYSKHTRSNVIAVAAGATGNCAPDAGNFDNYPTVDISATTNDSGSVTYETEHKIIFYGAEVRSVLRDAVTPGAGEIAGESHLVMSPARFVSGELVSVNDLDIVSGSNPEVDATYDSFKPDGSPPYTEPADLTQRVALTTRAETKSNHYRGTDDMWAEWPARELFITAQGTINRIVNRVLDGSVSWNATSADFEPTSTSDPFRPYYDTRWGTWIASRNTWAYSMVDLASTNQYVSQIKGGDLDALTGSREGVELYEQMWPLSTCLVNLKESR